MNKYAGFFVAAGVLASSIGMAIVSAYPAKAGSNYTVVSESRKGHSTIYKLKCTNGHTKYIAWNSVDKKWFSQGFIPQSYYSMESAARDVCRH